MKHKILVCVTLVLAGLTLLAISPTISPVFSKNNNTSPARISPHAVTIAPVALAPEDEASQIQRGFEIAPVQLDLRGKNRALVGLGSYIVNTGGCNDCHTVPPYAPGHNPFLGQPPQINVATYLGGGDHFGPFISRNITPDANGLPAGLTRDQFITALRTGIDKDGEILQVMPWPVFGLKTDRDLNAIYEYLTCIPSLSGPGPRDP